LSSICLSRAAVSTGLALPKIELLEAAGTEVGIISGGGAS